MKPSRTLLSDNLVHHVARELVQRARVIKWPTQTSNRLREISPAPLPMAELKQAYPDMRIEQWHMVAALPHQGWWQKLNPFANDSVQSHTWQAFTAKPDAQLVLAPFVLDGLCAENVLSLFEQLPQWFAPDGVVLFAMLGAGAVPELVNRDGQWLTHFNHLPNIMDTGARLQALRFGLPVLDVETVRLQYHDVETLWNDVLNLSPSLRALDASEQQQWREKIYGEFAQGLRELSLEIIFGQVWQPSTPSQNHQDSGVRTVSLESLTSSLKSNRTN